MNYENGELVVQDCKRSLEEVQKISMLGSSENAGRRDKPLKDNMSFVAQYSDQKSIVELSLLRDNQFLTICVDIL